MEALTALWLNCAQTLVDGVLACGRGWDLEAGPLRSSLWLHEVITGGPDPNGVLTRRRHTGDLWAQRGGHETRERVAVLMGRRGLREASPVTPPWRSSCPGSSEKDPWVWSPRPGLGWGLCEQNPGEIGEEAPPRRTRAVERRAGGREGFQEEVL